MPKEHNALDLTKKQHKGTPNACCLSKLSHFISNEWYDFSNLSCLRLNLKRGSHWSRSRVFQSGEQSRVFNFICCSIHCKAVIKPVNSTSEGRILFLITSLLKSIHFLNMDVLTHSSLLSLLCGRQINTCTWHNAVYSFHPMSSVSSFS